MFSVVWFQGSPVGGHIINYLLEKSRVCHQGLGDRNFHVFYQLVKGCENDFLKKFEIGRRVDMYYYLNQVSSNSLALPILRLLSPSGIHWIVLAEYSQMGTNMPGFPIIF